MNEDDPATNEESSSTTQDVEAHTQKQSGNPSNTSGINQVLEQDLEPEEINEISRNTLLELLKICEHHDISKKGLIEEMEHGLDPEKDTGNVTGNGKEVTDLDLEEIALRGEKRLILDLSKDQEDVPRQLIDHLVYCK